MSDQSHTDGLALLRTALDRSGASDRSFAVDVLGRDERTIRRWLSGDSPVPEAILPMLRLLVDGAVNYRGTIIMPRPMRLKDGGWSSIVHLLTGNEISPVYGNRSCGSKAEAIAYSVELARKIIDGEIVPRQADASV